MLQCLQKQVGSPKCFAQYIQINDADFIIQCTMQSHAYFVNTEKNPVIMMSVLIGWRKSADTIDWWLRLLPVHLSLPVMTTCYDQARCLSLIHEIYASAFTLITLLNSQSNQRDELSFHSCWTENSRIMEQFFMYAINKIANYLLAHWILAIDPHNPLEQKLMLGILCL